MQLYSLKHFVSLLVLILMLLAARSAIAQSSAETGRNLYEAGNINRCADCHDNGGGINAPIVDPQNQAEWRERLIPGGIRQLQENIRDGIDETGTSLFSHYPCEVRWYSGILTNKHCNKIVVYMLRRVGIPANRERVSSLYSLDLEDIEFSFNPAKTEYTINVGYDTASTTITAIPNNAFASVTYFAVNGISMSLADRPFHIKTGITLATGTNAIKVEITPQNSDKSTIYSIDIVRAGSPDATLSSLEIEDINFTFNPTTTTYNLEVDHDAGKRKRITAKVNNPAARVTKFVAISQTANLDRDISVVALSRGFRLDPAENLIRLEVTAEDGISKQNYFITIYKLTTVEQTDRLSGKQLYNSSGGCNKCHSSNNAYSRRINPDTGETLAPQATMASTATWIRRLRETKKTTLNEQIEELYKNFSEGQRYASLNAPTKTPFSYVNHTCASSNNPFGRSNKDKLTSEQCIKAIDYMLAQVGIFAPASSDATLLNLELENIDWVFTPSITAYNLEVGQDVENTTVTATVKDAEARIVGFIVNGTAVDMADDTLSIKRSIMLNRGRNIIQLSVRAENGDEQSHQVSVMRLEPPTFVVRVLLEGLLNNE